MGDPATPTLPRLDIRLLVHNKCIVRSRRHKALQGFNEVPIFGGEHHAFEPAAGDGKAPLDDFWSDLGCSPVGRHRTRVDLSPHAFFSGGFCTVSGGPQIAALHVEMKREPFEHQGQLPRFLDLRGDGSGVHADHGVVEQGCPKG